MDFDWDTSWFTWKEFCALVFLVGGILYFLLKPIFKALIEDEEE